VSDNKTFGSSSDEFFLFDAEKLNTIASESIVSRGLKYFKENRVFDVEWDATRIWGNVEGSEPDNCYSVELSKNSDGELKTTCNCPFIREPICKHIVAVLYSYAAQVADQKNLLGCAAKNAIQEREKKGRTEVTVEHISGEPFFGTWLASSIVSATHWKQKYHVHIRALNDKKNYCTCPDWSTNLLGTCKHIEAVLHQIKKQPDNENGKHCVPHTPFVYLSWNAATQPQIRLHRILSLDGNLNQILDECFDSAGLFKHSLPDEFFHFRDRVYGRDDIHIGEDVENYTRRLAEDAIQQLRGQETSESIHQSNGNIPNIRARLYPYQVEGVAFLTSRGRALLADDMGLGKTLQAICAASWLVQRSGVKRILVVCPTSLKHQWAREIEKFTDHATKVIGGGAAARHVQYRADAAFFIINYELVLRDLSVINETLKPDLIILDEAQRIKNWQTKIASTIKLIPSRYAFVLTGTPLENRLEDLYSLLQVVDPRVLGPLWRYLNDFHITDERDKVIGYRNLSELRRRIATVMLRRDRTLVRDQLPDRTEARVDVPMSVEQQELHGAAMSAAGQLADIAKKRPLTPSEQNRLMAALQQARMACNAAGLVDKVTEGSPKLDELANLLEDLCLQGGRKVVIFSQWERMTKMVEVLARKMDIGQVRLHGGVPTNKRGELIDRFRLDDAIQIFISTDAGGVGLNLQSASVLINLDIPWNPAILDQRIARVHRLGQKQKIQVILLLAEDSYEQHVFSLVQNKRDLFDNVVNSDAQEDVVGVSKRMLETIIEDLASKPASEPKGQAKPQAKPQAIEKAGKEISEEKTEAKELSDEDTAVRFTIEQIQNAFNERIERILGAGGGILVIMQNIDNADEQIAQSLSETIPVALVDPRTLAGFDRLGSASPINDSRILFEVDNKLPPTSRYWNVAREKLRAAELLVEQKCQSGAIELLSSAMLAGISAKAQLDNILSAEKVAVWIYAEGIPHGHLTPDQGIALLRVVSLVNASNIPENLIYKVMDDVRKLVKN